MQVYKPNFFALTFALVLLCTGLSAQMPELSTKKRRAAKQYRISMKAYDRNAYTEAEQALIKAIGIDNNFVEAHIFLSQVYQITEKNEEAIFYAEKAIAINPDFFPLIYFNLGTMYLEVPDYEKAQKHLEKFIQYKNLRKEITELAHLYIKNCEFAINAMNNPVPFTPVNLGPNVNTHLDEYWPSLSASESTLVITVKKPITSTGENGVQKYQEDFYITHTDATGEWQPVEDIGHPINTPHFNEGAQSLTADGQKMYFTICRGLCDLYVSQRNELGNWQRPKPLPKNINLPHASEKQPSISPDGKTLYFVSNRKDGLGNFDIWRSHKLDNNQWSNPENLGDSINTIYNEQSPFIHFDNKTLYFSSNGRVGMGKLDIFMSKMIDDTTWTTPKNLGYPINTHQDEDGLIVNAKGTTAYYSSAVDTAMGRDIYKFEIPLDIRPTPTSYITGTITDARSGWPVQANFSLVDIANDSTIMEAEASKNGSFLLTIPTNRSYALFASAPEYLYHSEHFDLSGIFSADEPYRKDIELTRIRIGSTMVMRNIFFETDSYQLRGESVSELNKLTELLNLNPTLKIEVGGHTDNVGNESYNLTLSENRASTVAQFLVDNGINSSRISWKGYGLTKPIGDNDTEDGRAENRRTEIRIIEI
ncbi:MAG TPA: OmpA family protein [Perlabentimonas sp.]|nr:OmpA family protein [Bacteroidales bacterium]MDY0347929.1 OmpA family protein [Tenuifilaceae bacterium]HZJ73736.1 OmpA family protein [Perlabentimonas sp.]